MKMRAARVLRFRLNRQNEHVNKTTLMQKARSYHCGASGFSWRSTTRASAQRTTTKSRSLLCRKFESNKLYVRRRSWRRAQKIRQSKSTSSIGSISRPESPPDWSLRTVRENGLKTGLVPNLVERAKTNLPVLFANLPPKAVQLPQTNWHQNFSQFQNSPNNCLLLLIVGIELNSLVVFGNSLTLVIAPFA